MTAAFHVENEHRLDITLVLPVLFLGRDHVTDSRSLLRCSKNNPDHFGDYFSILGSETVDSVFNPLRANEGRTFRKPV